jgi:hypothetical protein
VSLVVVLGGGATALRLPMRYEPASGRLSADVPADAVAVSVHRGEPGVSGPVIASLRDAASAQPGARAAVLLPYQRAELLAGRVWVSAITARGELRGRIVLP